MKTVGIVGVPVVHLPMSGYGSCIDAYVPGFTREVCEEVADKLSLTFTADQFEEVTAGAKYTPPDRAALRRWMEKGKVVDGVPEMCRRTFRAEQDKIRFFDDQYDLIIAIGPSEQSTQLLHRPTEGVVSYHHNHLSVMLADQTPLGSRFINGKIPFEPQDYEGIRHVALSVGDLSAPGTPSTMGDTLCSLLVDVQPSKLSIFGYPYNGKGVYTQEHVDFIVRAAHAALNVAPAKTTQE